MDTLAAAGELQSNPFVILTFIVAPAILTNASALMVLSTSNRFARAVDRARDLSRQVEEARRKNSSSILDRIEHELLMTEKRAVFLLKSLRAFYISLGGFALAAFVSLLGAGLANIHIEGINRVFAIAAVVSVFLAVTALMAGSLFLFYETRITVKIIQDRIFRLNRSTALEHQKYE